MDDPIYIFCNSNSNFFTRDSTPPFSFLLEYQIGFFALKITRFSSRHLDLVDAASEIGLKDELACKVLSSVQLCIGLNNTEK